MSDQAAPDTTTPTTTYAPNIARLRNIYERQSEAANLGQSFGDTSAYDTHSARAAQVLARLTKLGGNTQGIDVANFQGQFDPSSAGTAISVLAGQASSPGRNARAVRLQSKVSDVLKERNLAQKTNEFNQNILPTYTGAMDRLNQLAGTNAVSAQQEGQLRSQIANTNRTAAASNLGRVSAALGLRGMANSPAAAALASSVAQDYDVDLTNQLSDMGLQVSQMNRDQARQDSTMAATLANSRINAQNAYLSGDVNAVNQIGQDTAALIDALYSRDRTFELMQKQVDAAGKTSFAERFNNWANVGKNVIAVGAAPFTGGTSLLALGGGGGTGGGNTSPATGLDWRTSTYGNPDAGANWYGA